MIIKSSQEMATFITSTRKETLIAARAEPAKSCAQKDGPKKGSVREAEFGKSSVRQADTRKGSVRQADPEKSSVRQADPEKSSTRKADPEDSSIRTDEPEKSSVQKRKKAEQKCSDRTADNIELRNVARSRRMKRNAARSRHMKRKVSVLDQSSGDSVQDQVCNSVSPSPHTNYQVCNSVSPYPHTNDQVCNSVSPSPHTNLPHDDQPQTQCKNWVMGNCVHGDKCKDMHSWFCGSGFTILAKLQGHTKAITGIALPSGFDKLYSVAKDGTMSGWDCNSGQCAGSITTHAEIGCLMAEGPWVCVGFPNCVKAYNVQNGGEFCLAGPGGLVCSMVEGDEKLFAGMEDGTILVWNWNMEKIPEPAGMMKEHNGVVCSLVVGGANRLYSASRDSTIKMWDRQNLHCLQTLHGHARDVMSVICWDYYLISASLDNTLKVWCATESGKIEVTYEIKEDCGMIALCGIHDAEVQPILLCSCGDNTVRLYDLPSFKERGRICSKHQVEVISIGTGGLFFTGDASGEASVWKLLGSSRHDS